MALSKEEIRELYTNPSTPGALSSAQSFLKSLRLHYADEPKALRGWTVDKLKEAIADLPAYTLYKQPHRPNRSERFAQVMVSGPNSQWQCDLVEYPKHFAKVNRGYYFLLVCVDVFTKKAYTRAIKTKTAREVSDAFEDIFLKAKVPRKIQTDSGKEFFNSLFAKVCKKHHIKHFSTANVAKSQIVERLNKTLKERQVKIQQMHRGLNWIDHYKDVTNSYNNTIHSAHGFTPNEVSPINAHLVRAKLYYGAGRYKMQGSDPALGEQPGTRTLKKVKPSLKPGTYVRLDKYKRTFEKGYTRRWTTEVFRVLKRLDKAKPERYIIEDQEGNEIKGSFYRYELQAVDLPHRWAVHKKRVDKKRKLVLVTFDSIVDKEEWVKPSELKKDKNTDKWWWYDPTFKAKHGQKERQS